MHLWSGVKDSAPFSSCLISASFSDGIRSNIWSISTSGRWIKEKLMKETGNKRHLILLRKWSQSSDINMNSYGFGIPSWKQGLDRGSNPPAIIPPLHSLKKNLPHWSLVTGIMEYVPETVERRIEGERKKGERRREGEVIYMNVSLTNLSLVS